MADGLNDHSTAVARVVLMVGHAGGGAANLSTTLTLKLSSNLVCTRAILVYSVLY